MKLELVDPYLPRAEAVWRTLEDRARPTYFLTWGWIENWLACLPRHEAPPLAVIASSGSAASAELVENAGVVAACFLGRRRMRRHTFVQSRALFLNTTGRYDYDDLCIEHNGLLAAPDAGVSLAQLVRLVPGDWDELYLPAVDAETFATLAATALPDMRIRIDREVADYYVDLARVREQGYIPLLGSSTRAQMRKAQRAAGEVAVEVAADDRAANDIYDELVALHQRSWRMRGHPGAFADPWFDRFHRRLIAKRFRHGEIQLVRVKAGDVTLGCLYNFISAGRVLFYQCGFASPADRHIRPGYLCHAHAIEHCARQGLAIYDLLGGDARYKSSLATNEARLVWGRVQRKRMQFALEDRARTWVRARRAA